MLVAFFRSLLSFLPFSCGQIPYSEALFDLQPFLTWEWAWTIPLALLALFLDYWYNFPHGFWFHWGSSISYSLLFHLVSLIWVSPQASKLFPWTLFIFACRADFFCETPQENFELPSLSSQSLALIPLFFFFFLQSFLLFIVFSQDLSFPLLPAFQLIVQLHAANSDVISIFFFFQEADAVCSYVSHNCELYEFFLRLMHSYYDPYSQKLVYEAPSEVFPNPHWLRSNFTLPKDCQFSHVKGPSLTLAIPPWSWSSEQCPILPWIPAVS